MRKLIAAGISALVLGTALPAGTGSAHAAGWEYENWYFSQNNCLVAGGELATSDPSVIQTRCDGKDGGIWYLYALR
ncbi:hypothetical protein [Streptomyces johnsoniae]|uniref:Ricin B lectin domain-containing protein n=1 Tax=Streptomyces johnsoniae TaxID=3075532 RepID=A0ABU2SCI9_9ACTN|nr:hypothetical protein [Streptomyces sp. DSM 41886]MDT0446691.1 hypothetical protein [Streptomyces sp. DSM 41886]